MKLTRSEKKIRKYLVKCGMHIGYTAEGHAVFFTDEGEVVFVDPNTGDIINVED